MNKIQEYRKLCDDVRSARAFLELVRQSATCHQDLYDLSAENTLGGCITKFERVKLPNGQINDEGGMTVYCEHLFGDQVFCDIWKCDCAKQFDRFCYIKSKQALDDAIAARRAFVRNLFKKRSK